jgi:membrane protein implicated in regulation of membrane protease activity
MNSPFLQSPAAWWLAAILFALCVLMLVLIGWQGQRHARAVLSEHEARENAAPHGSVNYIYDHEVSR